MTYVIHTTAGELGGLAPAQRKARVHRLRARGVTAVASPVERRYVRKVPVARRIRRARVEYRDPYGLRRPVALPMIHATDLDGLGFSLRPPKWLRKAAGAAFSAGKGVLKTVGKGALKLAAAHPALAIATAAAGGAGYLLSRKSSGSSPMMSQRLAAMVRAGQATPVSSTSPLGRRLIDSLRLAQTQRAQQQVPLTSTLAPTNTAESAMITRSALMADTSSVEAGMAEPLMEAGSQNGETIAEKPVLAPAASANVMPLVLAGVGGLILLSMASKRR